jgi:leucyl aminopeptidase
VNIQFVDQNYDLYPCLAFGVCKTRGLASKAQEFVPGNIQERMGALEFKGNYLEHSGFFSSQQSKDLIFIGLGDKPYETSKQRYDLGGLIFTQVAQRKNQDALVDLNYLDDNEMIEVAFGAALRNWTFDKYLSKKTSASPKNLYFVVQNPEKASQAFKNYALLAQSIHRTRELMSEPGNIIYPETFVQRVQELTTDGIEVEILDQKRLQEEGFGALLGVAQGSTYPPFLAIMKWNGGRKGEAPLAFVGKGVTFDSGGLSLKPSNSMADMKFDKTGAAVVVGLMEHLAQRKAQVNAIGIVALVENMPSGHSQRPGDIVRSLSGKTIEVLDTDAEGRLILADALWYTQQTFHPRLMIDLATLTGAIWVTFASEYAGVFGTDDTLIQDLVDCGKNVGEKLWPLPLGSAFDEALASPVADMQNIASRGFGGGSITAAQFLKRFVNDDMPWAHLDIASVYNPSKDTYTAAKGANGFGVCLLNEFVKKYEYKV